MKKSKKLRVFEAFAGIGAQASALKRLSIDYEIVGISDWFINAIECYDAIQNNNKPDIPLPSLKEQIEYLRQFTFSKDSVNPIKDITKLSEEEISKLYRSNIRTNNYGSIIDIGDGKIKMPDCDLFIYSFPCQDLSTGGKTEGMKRGSGTRSGLLWEIEKILKRLDSENRLPEYLLMENVKNLLSKKFKPDFNKWCEWLEKQGYKNYYKVINSLDMGIPQSRERVFMVSILGNKDFKFPENKKLKYTFKELLEEEVNSKYYLTLDKIEKINNWKSNQNPFDRLIGKNSVCPTLTARGAGEYHSGAIIIGNCLNNKNIREEIKIDPVYAQIMYKPRFLTSKEAFRLMGVSDEDYKKINFLPERQLYKMAGNSIVVQVLEEIFKNLLY